MAPEGKNRFLNGVSRNYAPLGGAVLAGAGLLFLLSKFNLLPANFSIEGNISYGLVFLIGLLASVSTCLAVTGGLLVSLASKYNEQATHLPAETRFVAHLSFNAGRIISYTAFGGLIGLAGSALTLSPAAYGIVAITASILMLLLGLQMLGLSPRVFKIGTPNIVKRWSDRLSQRRSGIAAFILGGLTFFLPCGFTQALQLYVLAKADPIAGALTMLAFSLGTLPVLLGISFTANFAGGNFKRYFFRFAGAAVIFLSFASIQQGLVLLDLWPEKPAIAGKPGPQEKSAIKEGKQVVEMKVVGLEYVPNRFMVVEGIPVEWRIDAQEAEGCGRVIVIPKLRISRLLSANALTIIQFTPETAGDISFNCGMGMMTPGSKFVVTPRSQG